MINSETLRTARTAAGRSQRRLARDVGLNYQMVRRLEAGGDDGNLTLRDLERICTTLGIHPTQLLAAPQPTSEITPGGHELDVREARLLRRIHRGEDPRRTLTKEQRELVLPKLVRRGIVVVGSSGRPTLTASVVQALTVAGPTAGSWSDEPCPAGPPDHLEPAPTDTTWR